jgi:hypothetical protein
MKDRIDLEEVQLAERACPLLRIRVQHDCPRRWIERIDVRAAREIAKSQILHSALESGDEMVERFAVPAPFDERLSDIKVVHDSLPYATSVCHEALR